MLALPETLLELTTLIALATVQCVVSHMPTHSPMFPAKYRMLCICARLHGDTFVNLDHLALA